MRKLGRILFWAVLSCAMVLPLVAQAQTVGLLLTAPAGGCQISAQKCHMADCACPCCQHKGSQGHKSACRCQFTILPCLPAAGGGAPLQQNSASYATYIAPHPSLIITDIFRPPQS